MSVVKKVLMVVAVIIILQMLLSGINVLRNGFGGWDSGTTDKILGLSVKQASIKGIEKLSRFDLMQLFIVAKKKIELDTVPS